MARISVLWPQVIERYFILRLLRARILPHFLLLQRQLDAALAVIEVYHLALSQWKWFVWTGKAEFPLVLHNQSWGPSMPIPPDQMPKYFIHSLYKEYTSEDDKCFGERSTILRKS